MLKLRQHSIVVLLFAAAIAVALYFLVISPEPAVFDGSTEVGLTIETGIETGETVTEQSNRSALYSAQSETGSSIYASEHLATFDVLLEIAARLSEVQIEEADNEIAALVSTIDQWNAEEQNAFLDFFIQYMNDGNGFNPEAIVAFNSLWNALSLDEEQRIYSAEKLASHYLQFYEFAFAIAQFEILLSESGNLNSQHWDEYARALFQLGDFEMAINASLEHIDLQYSAGNEVARETQSRLFEAYFRSGAIERAEQVGLIILDQYEDLQDWKDMEQFYLATENATGLTQHLERAKEAGLLDENGNWND